MAVSEKLQPPEPTVHTERSSSSQSSTSTASSSDAESSISTYNGNDQDAGDSTEVSAMASVMQRKRDHGCISRASPTPACLRVPRTRCKARCMHNGCASNLQALVARLHQQLHSLRSTLPPFARSAPASNVIMDALRYKKALAKQIEMLQSALPFSHQVNVQRLGSAGMQIRVSCNKEPGLLVALMEALESFGLSFANMSISCLNNKIRIDAVSTKGSIGERRGSLKVALMATIMHFTQKGQERQDNDNM